MKIQNMSIIFLVIAIPLILILAYYISLQRDTLKMQATLDLKLSEATKEGIRAYEININDYTSTVMGIDERKNANAMINAFLRSLANKLNIGGTAKEYISQYIPAIAITMYDGYYIYAPSYVPKNWENNSGVQLYLDGGNVTEKSSDTAEPLYIAATGGVSRTYNGVTKSVTTDISKAEYHWEYLLGSKIAYTQRCTGNNMKLVMNYTLDNRVFFYGTEGSDYIEKDGYLVYFDTATELPRITITNEKITTVNHAVYNTIYSRDTNYKTLIEPETLEEQILYSDAGVMKLGTFKYVYDISHNKLYYDDTKAKPEFFKLDGNRQRKYLGNRDESIEVGDPDCVYKSVSVLVGTGQTREYKKIYQVLNGKHQGKWYMNLKKDDPADLTGGITEDLDTEIKEPMLTALGLSYNKDGVDYTPLYKDYSAISYYVEAYAFTNWVNYNDIKCINSDGSVEGLKITKNNDPEDNNSDFVQRKRRVAKENINKNLNLAISTYGGNTPGIFQLPVLTEDDWNQVFSNISLLAFFQGYPIGLKTFNSYAIATSTSNYAYVDPAEILFRANGDINYHRVYCEKTENIQYTGYRSIEYLMKNYVTTTGTGVPHGDPPIYYYQHDVYSASDNNAERGCYYCAINKANYTKISGNDAVSQEKTYKQAKSYNEALARERYYQKEALTAHLIYQEKTVTIVTERKVQGTGSSKDAEVVVVLDYEFDTMPWHNNTSYGLPSKDYVDAITAAAGANGIPVTFVSTYKATLGPDYNVMPSDVPGIGVPSDTYCRYNASFELALKQFSGSGATRVLLVLSYHPTDCSANPGSIFDAAFSYLNSHSSDYDKIFGTYCCQISSSSSWSDWNKIDKWCGELKWSTDMTERFNDLLEHIGPPPPSYEDEVRTTGDTDDLVLELPGLNDLELDKIYVTIKGIRYNYKDYPDGLKHIGGKYYWDFKDIVTKTGMTPDVWNAADVAIYYVRKG